MNITKIVFSLNEHFCYFRFKQKGPPDIPGTSDDSWENYDIAANFKTRKKSETEIVAFMSAIKPEEVIKQC